MCNTKRTFYDQHHPTAAAIFNKSVLVVSPKMVATQIFTLSKLSQLEVHDGQGISGVVKGYLDKIGNIEFLHRITGKALNRDMNGKYIPLSNQQ